MKPLCQERHQEQLKDHDRPFFVFCNCFATSRTACGPSSEALLNCAASSSACSFVILEGPRKQMVRTLPEWLMPSWPMRGTRICPCQVGSPVFSGVPSTTSALPTLFWAVGSGLGKVRPGRGERCPEMDREGFGDGDLLRDGDRFLGVDRLRGGDLLCRRVRDRSLDSLRDSCLLFLGGVRRRERERESEPRRGMQPRSIHSLRSSNSGATVA
mmetsp:Transcript_44404/g.117823  ORF Transcript_44404/g.117823 Transcript_44404/m.117823 type:complete len:213 (+) Transcript_44404:101-739(+)